MENTYSFSTQQASKPVLSNLSGLKWNPDGISIYNASTLLISDVNDNGFYHQFSVTIDADTIYNTAYIYARLYLSFEGGAWNHYASSDIYHIHGDSESDTFVIETELVEGFPPGYYDVRIELYDGYDKHWLLSYSSYDDASLNALPLEDHYFDHQHENVTIPIETIIVVADHTGVINWLLLLLLHLDKQKIDFKLSSTQKTRTMAGSFMLCVSLPKVLSCVLLSQPNQSDRSQTARMQQVRGWVKH